MSLIHVFYGGNGTTPVDSGLPRKGVFYGVRTDGDLLWYRYNGHGESDRSGTVGWDSNSGHPIGNGWQSFLHVLGCGDGVILGIKPDGRLLWYRYDGNGEEDRDGIKGWHPNSGKEIGHGWQNFRHVFVTPQEGWTSANSSRLSIYGVEQDGALRWYSYHGNGEEDRDGIKGWHPNSGKQIGNGWHNFLHIWGSGGVIFGIHESGNLLWYAYHGDGELDPSGTRSWSANSGHPINEGWQNTRSVFGGATDSDGGGHVIYRTTQNGDLHWYRYDGHGEKDPTGSFGWRPNSGNVIGNGW